MSIFIPFLWAWAQVLAGMTSHYSVIEHRLMLQLWGPEYYIDQVVRVKVIGFVIPESYGDILKDGREAYE